MILVDTSAWIELLRKHGDAKVKAHVARYLSIEEAAFTCPVRFELLAGARDSERGDVEQALEFGHHLPFTEAMWVKAADMERGLRGRGVMVPRDDIFVATVALEHNVGILCKDRHFDLMRDRGRLPLTLEQFA
jgi:predicted nucleic acid-binding protein